MILINLIQETQISSPAINIDRMINFFHQEIIEGLTKENVNIKLRDGYTRLHKAVYLNFLEETKLLLDLGADTDVLDMDYRTPLSWAVQSGADQIVKLLMSKGADINRADYMGINPLHLAWINKEYQIGTILLEAGAEITTWPILPEDPADFDDIFEDEINDFFAFITKCHGIDYPPTKNKLEVASTTTSTQIL